MKRGRGTPLPVGINLADSNTIQIGLATVTGQIIAIRIQDITRNIWYSWDKNTQYPNGYWDNAGGGGTNAPVGQTPMVTPGTNNLYVSFSAVNNGSVTGNMTLNLKDPNGTVLKSVVNNTPAAGYAGLEATITMPTSPYSLTLTVTP